MPSKADVELWTWRAALGGGIVYEAEWTLGEKPSVTRPDRVQTRVSASILAYTGGPVRWGVTFHRYKPRSPLQMRTRTNRTTGKEYEEPPLPIIPEAKINGRIDVGENGLEAAVKEAKEACEQTVRTGRPRP